MTFSDKTENIHIELDTKQCDLTADEITRMETALDPLAKLVETFPTCDLYITVAFRPRTNEFEVKTSLLLPGRTLSTGDHDDHSYPAYERCIRKLVKSVTAYKDRLSQHDEQSKTEKGTHRELLPTQVPDAEAMARAVADGDYVAFRRATYTYEEPLRKRIGRWVQRFPEVEARIDDTLKINDVVEEVFLTAFDQFDDRPHDVTFHDWLERLIDPSLKLLIRNPDEELENIDMARSLREAMPE